MITGPRIERDNSETILRRLILHGEDHLGYVKAGGHHQAGDDEYDADMVSFADDLAAEALEGRGRALPRLRRIPTDRKLDAVSVSALRWLGVHPGVVLALWHLIAEANEVLQIQDDEEEAHARFGGREWQIALGQGVTWMSGMTLAVPELPLSVALASRGEPLRGLVSHPALDAHHLRIESLKARDGNHLIAVHGDVRQMGRQALWGSTTR